LFFICVWTLVFQFNIVASHSCTLKQRAANYFAFVGRLTNKQATNKGGTRFIKYIISNCLSKTIIIQLLVGQAANKGYASFNSNASANNSKERILSSCE